MEVMHALFLLHAESPSRVTARLQIAMHCLTNATVFKLNLIAELDRGFRRICL